MKKYKLLIYSSIVILFFWILLFRADAANFSMSLTVSPSSPAPGEIFTVTARTPLFDKNTAAFRWTVNGVVRQELSGFGKNSITLQAGGLGTKAIIAVDVSRAGEGSDYSTKTVTASDLILTWSADTYIPRWFKGKALPSRGSAVHIVAIPEIYVGGTILPIERLIFTWDIDDQRAQTDGVGLDTVTIEAPTIPNDTRRVRVSVRDISGKTEKAKTIFIEPVTPRIALYQYLPLGGIFHSSSVKSGAKINRGTKDFLVEPFFFLTQDKKNLKYEWLVAGIKAAGAPENPYFLSLNTNSYDRNTIPVAVFIEQIEKFKFLFSSAFTFTL